METDLQALNEHLSRVAQAVARLERKTDFILRHLNLEYKDEPESSVPQEFAEVYALLKQGKKVEAIRAYRMATGLGMNAAKVAVEEMELGLKGNE